MSLVVELRRRNVFRVAAAYLVVGWLLTEVLTTILPTLGAPEWASRAVILTFAFGFIPPWSCPGSMKSLLRASSETMK